MATARFNLGSRKGNFHRKSLQFEHAERFAHLIGWIVGVETINELFGTETAYFGIELKGSFLDKQVTNGSAHKEKVAAFFLNQSGD